jgi:hypothetical protein
VKAGLLDREVSIWRKATSADPEWQTPDATYGTERVVWLPLVPLAGSPLTGERFPAEVQDALPSRSEGVVQGMRVSRQGTRIRMRYRTDITADMRVIVHGDADVTYQIIGGPAEIGGRKNGIEIVCERVSTDPA